MMVRPMIKYYFGLLLTYYPLAPVIASETIGPPSATATVAQTFLGLLVVVAAIIGFAWLLKKIQERSGLQKNEMKLTSVMPLGTREKAVLVDVKGVSILLGVAPGRVSALHVFDSREEDDAQSQQSEPQSTKEPTATEVSSSINALAASTSSEFSQKLQKLLGTGNSKT